MTSQTNPPTKSPLCRYHTIIVFKERFNDKTSMLTRPLHGMATTEMKMASFPRPNATIPTPLTHLRALQ